jgi:hypothetical protein
MTAAKPEALSAKDLEKRGGVRPFPGLHQLID